MMRMKTIGWRLLVSGVLVLCASSGFAQTETDLKAQFDEALLEGRIEDARSLGKFFLQSFPDSLQTPEVAYWLGCFQANYGEAMKYLESVARLMDSHLDLARMARQRMVEFTLLDGRAKEAVDLLRDTERRERDNLLMLEEARLQLTAAYLAIGRDRNARAVSRSFSDPGLLQPEQRQRYLYYEAVALWIDKDRKNFWQKQLEYEDAFPNTRYLPSLLYLASGAEGRSSSSLTADEKDYLGDILKYYSQSPEALLTRQALAR